MLLVAYFWRRRPLAADLAPRLFTMWWYTSTLTNADFPAAGPQGGIPRQDPSAATWRWKNHLHQENPLVIVKHWAHLFRDLSLRLLCAVNCFHICPSCMARSFTIISSCPSTMQCLGFYNTQFSSGGAHLNCDDGFHLRILQKILEHHRQAFASVTFHKDKTQRG